MLSRSIVRTVLVACVAFAIPGAAFADDGARNGKSATQLKHVKGDKAHFPMEAAKFKEKVESRITKTRARVVEGMGKRSVPADKQKEVLAKFDKGAAEVRALVEKAGKDGTVTQDEAKSVRDLTKSLKKQAHGERGKGKGKGKDKGKGAA